MIHDTVLAPYFSTVHHASATGDRVRYADGMGHLPASERARITHDLQAGLPGYAIDQYWANQPTIFADYDHCTIAERADGTVVGLLGARWFSVDDLDVLYLWTAQVATSAHHDGTLMRLATHLFDRILNERGCPPVLATKTFNPNVYDIFFHKLSPIEQVVLYPTISAVPSPPAVIDLTDASSVAPAPPLANTGRVASRIAASLWAELAFDATTGVLRGGQASVAPDFFPGMPPGRDARTEQYFRTHLTPADQVLCLALFDEVAATELRRALDLLLDVA